MVVNTNFSASKKKVAVVQNPSTTIKIMVDPISMIKTLRQSMVVILNTHCFNGGWNPRENAPPSMFLRFRSNNSQELSNVLTHFWDHGPIMGEQQQRVIELLGFITFLWLDCSLWTSNSYSFCFQDLSWLQCILAFLVYFYSMFLIPRRWHGSILCCYRKPSYYS